MTTELPIDEMFKFVKVLSEELKDNGKEAAEELLKGFLREKCGTSSIKIEEIIDDLRSTETLTEQPHEGWLRQEWTLLHCAANLDDVETCKFLIEQGADIFALNHNRQDTLSIASKIGAADAVDFLIEEINKKNLSEEERLARIDSLSRALPSNKKFTVTPLLHACGKGKTGIDKNRIRVIKSLPNEGANPEHAIARTWDNESDQKYYTAAHILLVSAYNMEKTEENKNCECFKVGDRSCRTR